MSIPFEHSAEAALTKEEYSDNLRTLMKMGKVNINWISWVERRILSVNGKSILDD